MLHPINFEQKIGFSIIREMLKTYCLSTPAMDMVDKMKFSTNIYKINYRVKMLKEFRLLLSIVEDFPTQYFFDMREPLQRIALPGTLMEEKELLNLAQSLGTIHNIVNILTRDYAEYSFETLRKLADVETFPHVIKEIYAIIDQTGVMKDNASSELFRIRKELSGFERSISSILNGILRSAKNDGYISTETMPALRDGRLVIPVEPTYKRKIKGIIHGESATGKTIFIEPEAVVQANNQIRELEIEERKEIIRILKEFALSIKPMAEDMLTSFKLLANIDFLLAKTKLAEILKANEIELNEKPIMQWEDAYHPILRLSLEKQNRETVPLNIALNSPKQILLISGPNAGGKSVCLKTVGLLQYMMQCSLSVPMRECSKVGMFRSIMIDIGDQQSIENDLSTYSSHLLNMKQMLKYSNSSSLVLIDEFGSGTEPKIGGAIAESILSQFCKQHTWGVITTHYHSLKQFVTNSKVAVNGAMLYDSKQMIPLFQLSVGQPGSSFAIEIAQKAGIPQNVIQQAKQLAGEEYVESDRFLQDIVRDKKYWESKKQSIQQREKELETIISKYQNTITSINEDRKNIINKAKNEAQELLKQSNKQIENVIKEIKESQAEKQKTREIREKLQDFQTSLNEEKQAQNDFINRKIQQIQQRKERKEKRKKEKLTTENIIKPQKEKKAIEVGDYVKIKNTSTTGKVESINGKNVTIIFGDLITKAKIDTLERTEPPTKQEMYGSNISKITRQITDERRKNFSQELDIRGVRGDEAMNVVQDFIDDAILSGASQVRILHGKGDGILHSLVQKFLSQIPAVKNFHDEHVQFGGSGITVVEL